MTAAYQQLSDFIQSVFPMHPITAGELSGLFTHRRVGKHEFLLREGQYCSEYFFLYHGFVRSYLHNLDGDEVTTAFHSENSIVCELFSFFKRIPSRENLQTLCDAECLVLTYEDLQKAFHGRPEFREFGRAILINSYASLKMRTLSMMQDTAEQRYAALIERQPDIFQKAPLKYIASFLGITDTSLSRIRKEFSRGPGRNGELAK